MPDIKDAERFEGEWLHYRETLKTIELRSFDREFGGDEVVADNCSVHLEQMDTGNHCLIIRTATEYLMLSIGSDSGRAKVRTVAYDGGRNDA